MDEEEDDECGDWRCTNSLRGKSGFLRAAAGVRLLNAQKCRVDLRAPAKPSSGQASRLCRCMAVAVTHYSGMSLNVQ